MFGQSAGAGSIAALLAMPQAAGLFRRAIAQSVPGTFLGPDLAAAVSTTIAAEVGATATVDELARFRPSELVRAAAAVTRRMPGAWGPIATTPTPFSPVVDGDVLPEAPWSALAGGASRDIDLVVGHTRDEYRLLALEHGEVTQDEVTAALRVAPGGLPAYRTAYPGATPGELWELANADWLMRMPSLHLAEAHVTGGGRAWTYELTWGHGPNGASHSLDVLLVLGTLDVDSMGGDEARHVARRMRADWIAFATTGDPGWAPYDGTNRPTRVYDTVTATRPYPEDASRAIWSRHRFDRLELPTRTAPAPRC